LLEVDFLSIAALTKVLIPHMNKGSVICGVGSMAGVIGAGCRSYYGGVKAALNGFIKSLQAELHADGIHCMMENPGYVDTNVSKNALIGDGSKSFGKTDSNISQGMSVEDHS
jgi:dehydrogenase/reductase SDR family member 7B